MQDEAESFTLDKHASRPGRLVVWYEGLGMGPQLERVTTRFSVPVLSSGGFDGLTRKYNFARDCVRPTTVLHIGDLDSFGVDMFTALSEDVQAFAGEMGNPIPEFVRLAVTDKQVEQYSLPTAPPKPIDRHGKLTTQAEALDPRILADILHDAIVDRLDIPAFEMAQAEEAAICAELAERFAR